LTVVEFGVLRGLVVEIQGLEVTARSKGGVKDAVYWAGRLVSNEEWCWGPMDQ
jgi:hypothetical protein